jgi:flagellar hook-associated protein FlgK
MINSFFGINTTLNGLLVQQAEQNVLADNIAKTGSYVDANGYVMTTEQQLNVTQGAPYIFNTSNGNLALGTGPLLQSITRMRDSFLDTQIQQQSQIVGKEQVLANTLSQVQAILNGSPTTTLGFAVTQLGSAFSALATATAPVNAAAIQLNADTAAGAPAATIAADQAALTAAQANPAIAAAQQAAVNAGVAFASMANGQYSQLKNLQSDMNNQVQQDVTSVNNLLQQINQVNQALLNSPGSNQNDLLDARDYDVTLLSRLANVQAVYGSNGTASVYLSGLALVNSSGAATLSTNVENPHNPGLVDITVQSPQGTITFDDASSLITGGELAGDLQARDGVIQTYMQQVDQISFSVSQLANLIYSSGYVPGSTTPGSTTGINFFVGGAIQTPNTTNIAQTPNPANSPIVNGSLQVGASAADIGVNAALVSDPGDLAYSSAYGNFVNNEVATALGELPNLLTNNFVASNGSVGVNVDPGTVLGANGSFNPVSGSGTLSIDSNTPVNYNNATDSIYSVLSSINANNNNVVALFNYNAQQVLIFSNSPINMTDSNGTNGFMQGMQLNEVLTSSIRMNNGFAPTDPQIDPSTGMYTTPANLGIAPPVPVPYTAGNATAFRVTPSQTGTFTVNGVKISFSNMNPALNPSATVPTTLTQIANAIQTGGNPITFAIGASFNIPDQQFILTLGPNSGTPPGSSLSPIQVSDLTGNFSVFTGLNASVSADSLASNLSSEVGAATQNATTLFSQANDALTQLNNEQANIGTLTTASGSTPGTAGTPVSLVEEQAMQALVAYNASLEMLQIQNQMFSDLLNVVAPLPPTGESPFVL